MSLTLPPLNRRTGLVALVAFILVVYGLSVPILPSGGRGLRGVKKAGRGGATYIYEMDTHDEVIGAIGVSVHKAGYTPWFACHFRFEFKTVLSTILGYEPEVQNPRTGNREIDRRLAEDTVDNLILTTCTSSLPQLHEAILKSSVNVICVIHHGGRSIYDDVKPLIKPLAEQGRVTLVTLGEHVTKNVRADVEDWAERELFWGWETLPIRTLVPIFDYPPNPQRDEPTKFPTHAVIQGNLEPSRRNYDKILKHLQIAMTESPSTWGYESQGTPNTPLLPVETLSPFKLHLVGQRNPERPVNVPVELQNVVLYHESISYPDYYSLIANCDLMIPAFAHIGVLTETASSSMAAALIAGIPILVSDRHLHSYTYVDGPAMLKKNISTSDVHAMRDLRTQARPRGRDSNWAWRDYKDGIIRSNAEMWLDVLR